MMLYDFMGVWGHTLHTLQTSMHRQQNNVISLYTLWVKKTGPLFYGL